MFPLDGFLTNGAGVKGCSNEVVVLLCDDFAAARLRRMSPDQRRSTSSGDISRETCRQCSHRCRLSTVCWVVTPPSQGLDRWPIEVARSGRIPAGCPNARPSVRGGCRTAGSALIDADPSRSDCPADRKRTVYGSSITVEHLNCYLLAHGSSTTS